MPMPMVVASSKQLTISRVAFQKQSKEYEALREALYSIREFPDDVIFEIAKFAMDDGIYVYRESYYGYQLIIARIPKHKFVGFYDKQWRRRRDDVYRMIDHIADTDIQPRHPWGILQGTIKCCNDRITLNGLWHERRESYGPGVFRVETDDMDGNCLEGEWHHDLNYKGDGAPWKWRRSHELFD